MSAPRPWLLACATVALFLAGSAYSARGAYFALTSAADYQLRWTEQQYVFRGKNPSAIYVPRYPGAPPRDGSHRTVLSDPDLGISIGGYPPWAYATGALFAWPSNRTAARWYFAALNFGFLLFLLRWAQRLGKTDDPWTGWLLAGAVLATSSICTTLGLGQYGLLVLVAVIGAYALDQRSRWGAAGLLMGIALIKVILAGPFLLPFLVRKRWKTLLTTAAFLGVTSLVLWPIVDTSPLTMMRQMVSASMFFVPEHNVGPAVAKDGAGAGDAVLVTAVVTTAAAMLLLLVWITASVLTHFAIAGVAARMWTYHSHYDNLILIFLLLALGVQAVRHHRWLGWFGFVLMGFSLWPPARIAELAAFQDFQWAAWVASLGLLLFLEWPGSRRSQNDLA